MQQKIQYAPTLVYPESDGKPMAETDTHRDLIVVFIQMLKHYFRDIDDAYVSGNLLLYYEEGNLRKSVSPDVFVAFGVNKKQRRIYLIWEEGSTPDFVLEVASRSTFRQDMRRKKALYASVLEVKEYYIYDPGGEIQPHFIGYRLVDGVYQEIEFVNERLPSAVLGLELGEREGVLRLYNPRTQQWLQPPEERAENAESHAQQELLARQHAEERAENAEERAENAETELARALAELERLQANTTG